MAASYSAAAYRTASASGATHIGLLLLVYDALASDLQRAAEALAQRDIAARCRHSNHASLLLGHLEQWCTLLDDATLATSLKSFYGHLRAQMLRLQLSGSSEEFSALAKLVAETRAVWQLKEQQVNQKRLASTEATPASDTSGLADGHEPTLRWSA